MTNYGTQCVLGPVISPAFSKDKGDFSNRMQCAGAQLANNAKTLLADTVVIGGALGGIACASKNKGVAKGLAKITHSVANFIKSRGGFGAASKLKRLPLSIKAGLPIMAVAMPLLGYITHKALYKMGQIDQKYSDKAKIYLHQKQII